MIIICVAVRLKSSRCPEKALAELAGKPLIERLTERVEMAERPAEIVWCTSTSKQDEPLCTLAADLDINYVIGSELDVMGRFLAAAEQFDADHIVRVTGDNPLTDPELIDHMIDLHLDTDADYTRCDDAPRGTRPEIIRTEALEELYNRIEPDESEYMTYQLMLMKKKAIYKSGYNRRDVRLTVDTPEDLERVQALYNDFHGNPPPLEDVIAWYDKREQIQ